jgi:prepilin-type processing-associated H-X9-DG protein
MSGIFSCPAESTVPTAAKPWNWFYHYGMNLQAAPTVDQGASRAGGAYGYFRVPVDNFKWSKLKPNKVLLGEVLATECLIQGKPGTAAGLPQQVRLRHGSLKFVNKDGYNGANYLFADGHAEYSMEYHRARRSGAGQIQTNYYLWWDHGSFTAPTF